MSAHIGDPSLNERSVKFALQRIISELDYDLWKDIENPEDPDESPTWDELAEIFAEAYDEDQEHQGTEDV